MRDGTPGKVESEHERKAISLILTRIHLKPIPRVRDSSRIATGFARHKSNCDSSQILIGASAILSFVTVDEQWKGDSPKGRRAEPPSEFSADQPQIKARGERSRSK
jgi:hypothetical protein